MGKVAEGLDQVASHVPDGYDDWKEIAENGAKAARDNDVAAVKRACKTCHDQHQKRYRKERRTEPLI
jgi:cytochrome c551/c552